MSYIFLLNEQKEIRNTLNCIKRILYMNKSGSRSSQTEAEGVQIVGREDCCMMVKATEVQLQIHDHSYNHARCSKH